MAFLAIYCSNRFVLQFLAVIDPNSFVLVTTCRGLFHFYHNSSQIFSESLVNMFRFALCKICNKNIKVISSVRNFSYSHVPLTYMHV